MLEVRCFCILKFHCGQIFDVRGLAFAIQRHNQGQADSDFRRCHRNDEEHHDLAVELVVEAGESDQRKIGGIEHQFERHVNDEQIAPDADAEQPETEQNHADDEIMFEADVHTLNGEAGELLNRGIGRGAARFTI